MTILFDDEYNKLKNIEELGDAIMLLGTPDEDDWDTWKPIYDKIFSERIANTIHSLMPDFDPYIPDTSYKEDVSSFWYSFKEELKHNTKIIYTHHTYAHN